MLATTSRGICGLTFVTADDYQQALSDLQTVWPQANLVENQTETAKIMPQVFPAQTTSTSRQPLTLLLKGTNFQLKVWQALLKIPLGQLCSYGDIAAQLSDSNAARAVGNAIGNNPIAYLIPCHRVIRQSGLLGQYRWGAVRKRVILGWEASTVI
ncbi:methylated-DNA--[protein]-cysteine S-methyltransferase [Anaerolineales bacterium HSG6]|nr:methylated-DNA--[protein]-cysteine S-methyltransferase [Anaerolineales bacterium HSG6]